ncbi:MAG: hypothetical protein ACFFDM_00015 [Candidatus Thorarchaeota archaeon]
MSDLGYEELKRAWKDEKDNESLQSLDDLKLSKMVKYLSEVRLKLAETPSNNQLQVDLFTQEGLNIEFMLRDLLTLRRNKILRYAFNEQALTASLTLAEEEFYDRVKRGFLDHSNFVEEIIAGKPVATMKRSKKEKKEVPSKKEPPESDELEYITVIFKRPVKEPFMGLDEIVHGPFDEGDTATIPTANAKTWLRNGTVERFVPTQIEADEKSG